MDVTKLKNLTPYGHGSQLLEIKFEPQFSAVVFLFMEYNIGVI